MLEITRGGGQAQRSDGWTDSQSQLRQELVG